MGKTALMSNLSCDSAIAGAFFPQPDSHVPEEEVGQHASNHMVTPPRIFSHLVVAVAGDIGRKDPNMRVLNLADAPAVLPVNASRITPLLHKPRFVKNQDNHIFLDKRFLFNYTLLQG